MARQNNAAIDARPDCGEDRGLVAGRIRRTSRFEPMPAQVALDKVDERQVRGVADALEGDQPREQRLGLGETGAARHPAARTSARGAAPTTTTQTVDGAICAARITIACTKP